MRRTGSLRIAVASATLLATVIGGAPARALDGNGCPSPQSPYWTGSRSFCEFKGKGFPIIFRGAVTEASGSSNWIRVWVAPRGYPDVVLAECSRSGVAKPSCSGGFPDQTTTLDVFRRGAEPPSLECHVRSSGSKGTFYCQSGSSL